MTARRFQHLLAPGNIGTLALRNRIIMTPMGSNLAEVDGHCGERIQAYYEARAIGGAGLLIVGVGAITWPEGSCNPNQVAVSDDVFLPGLKSLCERVHRHGSKVAIQLQHAGQNAVRDIAAGRAMLVPSIPRKKRGDMLGMLTEAEASAFLSNYTVTGAAVNYHEATPGDLQKLVQDFANAAERAKRAGFDGVEIHAGHGYILSAFLSRASNKRTDAYGGSLANRARLLLEVIRAIKQTNGADFPVWCRIDACEYRTDDGITLDDAAQTAQLAEIAGADAIHVSAYADNSIGIAFTEAPLVHREGGYLDYARIIKENISIPVIAVGRIEPDVADNRIANNHADFIAMGRKLLADPELPNKLLAGKPQDIRPCIYCYTCVSQIFLNQPVKCSVNALTGREFTTRIERTETPRHVLVVGGGPAGMEAARLAALRGHQVTLCEQGPTLGGSLFFAGVAYEPNQYLMDYLKRQIEQTNVTVRLQQNVDADFVQTLAPDVVIVAVGAQRRLPDLPGAHLPHVHSGDAMRNMLGGTTAATMPALQKAIIATAGKLGSFKTPARIRTLSRLWLPLGKRVVIIGGGLVGVELAEFLTARRCQVTVIEKEKYFGAELSPVRRWRLLTELRNHGVTLLNKACVTGITTDAVHYTDAEGEARSILADDVIIAAGITANNTLTETLRAQGYTVHSIGDCNDVAYIDGAMHSATAIALGI